MEAHATLVALLRSDLRVPGLAPDGDWPPPAKRLAKVAWVFADRLKGAAGTAGAERPSSLADDDVMLLCQGAEVLEALADRGGVFFQESERRESPPRSEAGQTSGRCDASRFRRARLLSFVLW